MRFQTGALGVVVVMVALVGMLMGSWVMSMDVTEEEVTKYNALTEIGGLFDSEKTPTFTDYNPSTNYTGYYTSNSIIGSDRFFDGVDFKIADNPNNFRVQERPTASVVDSNYDLDDLNPTDTVKVGFFYKNTQQYNERLMVDDANTMSISKVAEALGYTSGNVKLIMKNVATPSDFSDLSSYVTFYTPAMIAGPGTVNAAWFKDPSLTGTLQQYGTGSLGIGYFTDANQVSNPILAAKWDGISVTLYYDIEMKNPAGTYTADSVFVAWGGSTGTATLDDVAQLEYYELPRPQYMDPSKGVVME